MCLVSRGAFYGIRVPRLKKRTHDAGARCGGARLRSLFMVLLLGTTTRHRRTARDGAKSESFPVWNCRARSSEALTGTTYVTHLFDHIASTHPSPARSHTSSGTGIHPMEKPQRRREKPRPSSPQSGGLDETHYQLHQDHQASR